MIREIVTDKELLSVKCKECNFLELSILKTRETIKDLFDTAAEHSNCIGLAANQIGYDNRVIIARLGGQKLVAMVNPRYVPMKTQGVKRWTETCLSFPDKKISTRRYKKIKLTFNGPDGIENNITLTGLDAVIVQHEIDHLNGRLL